MTPKSKNKAPSLNLSTYTNSELPVMAIKSVHLPEDKTDCHHSLVMRHAHHFYELVVVVKGAGVHIRGSRRSAIRPGNVFLIRPRETHSYEYTEMLVLLNFMFTRNALDVIKKQLSKVQGYQALFSAGNTGEIIVNQSALAQLDILLDAISRENLHKTIGSEIEVIAKLMSVFVQVFRASVEQRQDSGASGHIATAISWMNRNYQQNLTIVSLAKRAHLSISGFYRKFIREFQMSPSRYLLELRMRKAMEFLLCSEKSVSDVADLCGFTDPLYFSRCFRKFCGCSPKDFRNRQHGLRQEIQGSSVKLQKDNPTNHSFSVPLP